MLQSLFKLFFLGIGVIGPFMAGASVPLAKAPEAYVFILIVGGFLGIGGLIGFAWLEADEAVRHERALRGREG